MSFLINPFAFAVAGDGDFESIATVTVGSGGASSIEFTSIGTDWQHLQLRTLLRTSRGVSGDVVIIQANGDTGNNYRMHRLTGNGSTAGAGSSVYNGAYIIYCPSTTDTASVFGASIVDVLDYASSTKTSTFRSFTGFDTNSAGELWLASDLWTSTSAITSLKLVSKFGTGFVQHSTAALFGVKAP